jgi:hypothetical protein
MWTVLETILLGIFLLYSTVRTNILGYIQLAVASLFACCLYMCCKTPVGVIAGEKEHSFGAKNTFLELE